MHASRKILHSGNNAKYAFRREGKNCIKEMEKSRYFFIGGNHQDTLDKVGFPLRVSITIPPVFLGQLILERGISRGVLGVRAQVIAEEEVLLEKAALRLDDVQVMSVPTVHDALSVTLSFDLSR